MFLKTLKIESGSTVIRDIKFQKGLNLIIDETISKSKKVSGNNVGKTTVLRLIDFCLGSDGTNIYKDPEFKDNNNTVIEQFLRNKEVLITLVLKRDLDDPASEEIQIKRNFLKRKEKIQEINDVNYGNEEFPKKLKELIFHSNEAKPTLRQIIAKNIRNEKNKLVNTIKVLHPTTTQDEYEALYLFWLGVSSQSFERKQQLFAFKQTEMNLQKRLRQDSTLSQIEQSLLVLSRSIEDLETKRRNFNTDIDHEKKLSELNFIRSKINQLSTEISRLEVRRNLILESREDLLSEVSVIDSNNVKKLYLEAKSLIPNLQKTFEDTLFFHNQMIDKKIEYITSELPELELTIKNTNEELHEYISQESFLSIQIKKSGVVEELEETILQLKKLCETRGKLEEQKRLWSESISKVDSYDQELDEINEDIDSSIIKNRITKFNKYFSALTLKLYGEQFILSHDKNEKGYELSIHSIDGNLGTGMKKGQIAAFDLAYIQFADSINIDCLHFILHDQIENIHDNQISSLLTDIVNNINCQYIAPVLKDKLPPDINIGAYQILSLSQQEKLFRLT